MIQQTFRAQDVQYEHLVHLGPLGVYGYENRNSHMSFEGLEVVLTKYTTQNGVVRSAPVYFPYRFNLLKPRPGTLTRAEYVPFRDEISKVGHVAAEAFGPSEVYYPGRLDEPGYVVPGPRHRVGDPEALVQVLNLNGSPEPIVVLRAAGNATMPPCPTRLHVLPRGWGGSTDFSLHYHREHEGTGRAVYANLLCTWQKKKLAGLDAQGRILVLNRFNDDAHVTGYRFSRSLNPLVTSSNVRLKTSFPPGLLLDFEYSPDGRTLAVAYGFDDEDRRNKDGTYPAEAAWSKNTRVDIFDATTVGAERVKACFALPAHRVSFSPDGLTLALLGSKYDTNYDVQQVLTILDLGD